MSPSHSLPPRSEAEQIVLLTKELEWSRLKIQALEERLRLESIRKYGPKSEKLTDNQLQLLDFEPGVSSEEVEAESRRDPLPSSSPSTTTKSKEGKHPGRQELPAHLPRVERVIACTPEQCVCKGCGKDKAVIGYEQSEQLDVEPARYFVLVTRREKRACRSCAEGVSAAPLPERIVEKSLVSDRVVIDTMVNKYSDHLPLYRQSAILLRDTGVSIGRATMDGWVMRVGEMLIPVVGTMGRELLAGSYIQADETPVPVQMSDGRGKNHQAFLWQYGTAVAWAYDVAPFQLAGQALPDARYDIVGKASAPATDEEMRVMMQSLLANRFGLKVRREEKEVAGMALLVAKDGAKLKPAEDQGESVFDPVPGKKIIHFGRMSMPEFARLLSEPMRKPVVDLTNLKGSFDFTLDGTKYEAPPRERDDEMYMVMRALQEEAGPQD